MITYADVQRVYRSEKRSPTLQKIDDKFYSKISELLTGIEKEHREYIRKLVDEIFERRRNKIVINALRSPEKEPGNMIPIERAFYAELTRALAKYKERVLSEKFKGEEEPAEIEKIKTEKIKVRFLRSLPSIIGSDMVHYGPFKEGDEVELPKDNAEILIDQEIVEEIEHKRSNSE